MVKVFVSATYPDMHDYRSQVERLLHRLGHEDISMAYYTAEEQRPLEQALADVNACDVFVGLYAWSYGYVPKKNNPKKQALSELEYRQALKVGKPCFLFMLDPQMPWPPDYIDEDRAPLRRFRNELSEQPMAFAFRTGEELGMMLSATLTQWVEQHHTPTHALISPTELATYREVMRQRYQQLLLDALPRLPKHRTDVTPQRLHPLTQPVFIEPYVRPHTPPIELPQALQEKVQRGEEVSLTELPHGVTLDDVWRARAALYAAPIQTALMMLTASQPRYRPLVILGEHGAGKTMWARYVALSLLEPTGDAKLREAFADYLPLIIELRDYASWLHDGQGENFLAYLENMGRTIGWRLTPQTLHPYLKNDGRVLIFFDGLDEVSDSERDRVVRQLLHFTLDYPKVRMVITSRAQGYPPKLLADTRFAHFTLQPFSPEQTATFIGHWYALMLRDQPAEAKDRRERALRTLKESAFMRVLASNPLWLTLLAYVGLAQDLEREPWRLYAQAASQLIQQWDINRYWQERRIEADFISHEDKLEWLRVLARHIQADSVGEGGLTANTLHRDKLQAEFESYLLERYGQSAERAKTLALAMLNQLDEPGSRRFILCRQSALTYGFIHPVLLQYFCALDIVHTFEKTPALSLEQLKQDVYGAHWSDPTWHETLRLICGMIGEDYAGEVIHYLVNEVNRSWSEHATHFPPWQLSLAIQCLGAMRNPAAVAEAAERLLQVVCMVFDYVMGTAPQLFSTAALAPEVFLREHIARPAEALGTHWPRRQWLVEWLKRRAVYPHAQLYAESFGIFVGAVGKGLAEALPVLQTYATHAQENHRVLAPYALTQGWRHDEQVLTLLQTRAAQDTSHAMRAVTLKVLIESFTQDSRTLPLLCERTVNDPQVSLRALAIHGLAEHFSHERVTVRLLHDRAINDPDSAVRATALATLARHAHARDDAQTFPLLSDRALHDAQPQVRAQALVTLNEYFLSQTAVVTLTHNCAANDADAGVRALALSTLARHAHARDDLQTLPLLRQRAQHDPDTTLRAMALALLARYFRVNPNTLPLLRERIVADTATTVRADALSTLVRYFPTDGQTLRLVHDRVAYETDSTVRAHALTFLAQHFTTHAETLSMLLASAAPAAPLEMRRAAIGALVEHFSDHPQVWSLLHERTSQPSSDKNVRTVLRSLLSAHLRDTAKT